VRIALERAALAGKNAQRLSALLAAKRFERLSVE
jgi:hypothetical protein